MGPLLVVLDAEAIEVTLLTKQVGSRRAGRFLLERTMHPLVASVLLGVAGLDQLGPDAQTDPPGVKSRESADGLRGEGRAVVATDDLRQAILTESSLQSAVHAVVVGRVESLADQEVTAEAVGDGERVAVEAVQGAELAFEG